MKYMLYVLAIISFSCDSAAVVNTVEVAEEVRDSIAEVETNPIFEIHQDVDTILLGDMNRDGKKDTAIVYSPFHAYPSPDDFSSGGCEDDSCLITVVFNFTETVLLHKRALGCQTFFATEDLNSDGINEIAFIPKWFQSCWQGLFVYSLDRDSWKQVGSGSVFACSDEDFSKRVVKTGRKSFNVISMRWNEDGSEMIDTTLVYRF